MKTRKREPDRNTKNRLEWAVFGLSCLLIAGVVGFLIQEATRSGDRHPKLKSTVSLIEKHADRSVVELVVTNEGGGTAADLSVQVIADFPSGKQETEVAFNFVPRQATRRARVDFLSTETATGVTPGVHSYREP